MGLCVDPLPPLPVVTGGRGEGLPPRIRLAESPPHPPRKSAATSSRKRGEVKDSVIARSDSDDPSTLAAQATPGWESVEARRAKAEAIQLSCRGRKLDCFASLAMTWR